MNLAETFLTHLGLPSDGAHDDILAPFIVADSAYLVYDQYIKPMQLKGNLKKFAQQFICCYRAATKQFFDAFDGEQRDALIERMDSLNEHIAHDIEILRWSVIRNIPDLKEDVLVHLANLTAILHLSQCAKILWNNLYKYTNGQPLHNKHFCGMVSYADSLFTHYAKQTVPRDMHINLNEVKDIELASRVLCNKIIKFFTHDNN